MLCLTTPASTDIPASSKSLVKENITLTAYHINQPTFGAAPVNMDTGDAKGDLYFDIRSVDLPLECAHPTPRSGHDCQNTEVVSPN